MQRRSRGPNVLVMSGAGKPIFVRYGARDYVRWSCGDLDNSSRQDSLDDIQEEADEEDWAMACSLVQAIRANVMSFGLYNGSESDSTPLGDIQSIQAGRTLIVFMNTEALTLVAITNRYNHDGNAVEGKHSDKYTETEAWLRLQLEYVYAQVIFTLTNQVNAIFQRSPSYDLRSMMGPNVNASLRNLLDRFDPVETDNTGDVDTGSAGNSFHGHGSGCGSFLTAAVECISPIPPDIRDEAGKLLISACRIRDHRKKQEHPSSQLHTSDLHLILTFVGLQPGLLTNELWFPICLPRFDASGFLYAFTSCLDPRGTGLSIVLISANNSTEQFEAFRSAAMSVRKSLGLPPVKSSVLRIYDSASSVSSSVITPVVGNRARIRPSEDDTLTASSGYSEESDPEKRFDDTAWKRKDADGDDYSSGNVDNDGKGRDTRTSTSHVDSKVSTYQDERIYTPEESSSEGPLVHALKVALSPKQSEEMMSHYLRLASAVHFVFRCEIFINPRNDSSPGGMLSQCFGPLMGFPFIDPSSQRHVWNIYQRLSLRLRLGSSTVEATMDAFDMIADGHDHSNIDSRGISRDCPMQCLLESPPCVHGVTYVQENNEWLYVGLNGRFFELYATLPGNIAPKTGTAYCARLIDLDCSSVEATITSNSGLSPFLRAHSQHRLETYPLSQSTSYQHTLPRATKTPPPEKNQRNSTPFQSQPHELSWADPAFEKQQ
eukprot:CCRYP_009172-RA/>CCRYP_009172-RA protein AED:0.31 eAED:0.43 QI:0/0/0/1/0.5/0.33/3/0/715